MDHRLNYKSKTYKTSKTGDHFSDFGLGKDFFKRTHEHNLYKWKKQNRSIEYHQN